MEKIFTITKTNGKKIAAKAYLPDENKKYPTVIFAHGFNGSYPGLEHHGQGFAESGIVCIFFDFCGGSLHTLSDCEMLDMTLLTEIEDLNEVIDYVSALDYVDESRISLQGESMGGLVSALVAAYRPNDIKSLVLWYPAFVVPDDSRRRFEEGEDTTFGIKLNPKFNEIAMNIDVFHIIGSYTGPVLIIHGDKDNIVPLSYSERAFECYDDVEMIVIPEAGHGYNGEDSRIAREYSADFINEHLE